MFARFAGTRTPSAATPTPATTPSRSLLRRKSKVALDDESSYCLLSEDGVEVLAERPATSMSYLQNADFDPDTTLASIPSTGKKLKRSGSLGGLLKTPSRLNLRKSASRLRLFADTPGSAATAVDTPPSVSALNHLVASPPPPVPAVPLQSAALHQWAYRQSASLEDNDDDAEHLESPTSRKSKKPILSGVGVRVIPPLAKDADSNSARSTTSSHVRPGTVASRVSQLERRFSDHSSHGSISSNLQGGIGYNKIKTVIPVPPIPSVAGIGSVTTNAGRTPNAKPAWLSRLHIGGLSSKNKKSKLAGAAPISDVPTALAKEKAGADFVRRSQECKRSCLIKAIDTI